eukprot:3651272-Prorocentrum_lima.AAC.1
MKLGDTAHGEKEQIVLLEICLHKNVLVSAKSRPTTRITMSIRTTTNLIKRAPPQDTFASGERLKH